MPADKYLEERNRARANFTHHMHQAIAHIETARFINRTHGLGLEVPLLISRCIADTVDAAAHAHQKENPSV